jgi:hypothetical protein
MYPAPAPVPKPAWIERATGRIIAERVFEMPQDEAAHIDGLEGED